MNTAKKLRVERSFELRVRPSTLNPQLSLLLIFTLSTLLLSTLNSRCAQIVIPVGTTANDHTGLSNRWAWQTNNLNMTTLFGEIETNNVALDLTNLGNLFFGAFTGNAGGATNLNTTNLVGTLQPAQFPAALPAISGASLTAVPNPLPATSGANLLTIPAGQLTGNATFGVLSNALWNALSAGANITLTWSSSGVSIASSGGGTGGVTNLTGDVTGTIAGQTIATTATNGAHLLAIPVTGIVYPGFSNAVYSVVLSNTYPSANFYGDTNGFGWGTFGVTNTGGHSLGWTNGALSIDGAMTANSFSGSGSGLTSIPASQLNGILPALNAAALTSLSAGNITAGGTFPAENGSALTALSAANLTAGGTFPGENAANLTNLPASGLAAGGTLPSLVSGTFTSALTLGGQPVVTNVSPQQATLTAGGTGGTNVTPNFTERAVSGNTQYTTNSFYLSMAGNCYLSTFSGTYPGQTFSLEVTNTGAFTFTYNTNLYSFPSGYAGPATTNGWDVISFLVKHDQSKCAVSQIFHFQ